MDMRENRLAKAATLLVACVLLLPALPTQSCETVDVSEDACCSCCCCQDSEAPLLNEGVQGEECSCEMSEGQKAESSPAVVTYQPEKRLQIVPLAEASNQTAAEYQIEFEGFHHHPVILPNKDQPLYILHSSFII
jgi:hypothetical protein